MIKINNFFDNSNVKCIAEGGVFSIYEHQHDLSVDSNTAMNSYFMEQMNVKKRQVLCKLDNSTVKLQAGAMQWITGDVEMDSGVSGAKDFFGKLVKGAVTGESAVKPLYTGTGCVMLEPTYNFLLIEDVASWGTAYSLLVKVIYKSQLIKEVMLPQHYYQEKVFSTLHFRVTVFVCLNHLFREKN